LKKLWKNKKAKENSDSAMNTKLNPGWRKSGNLLLESTKKAIDG
jgi:hypothetical protein